MKFKNLLCIFILILFILYQIKRNNLKEHFNLFNFKCINNSYSYSKDILDIKNNLENDRFFLTKSFECERLLNLYNIITCDLQKDNLSSINITNYLDIKLNSNNLTFINNIFNSIKIYSENLIYDISNLSNNITTIRYINPNINIINNLKNEFITKFV